MLNALLSDIKKLISSRANWAVVAMFVVGGVEAINQYIPVEFLPLVEAVLGLLAIYFIRNPSQEYGK